MKFRNPISLNVLSPLSLQSPSDFICVVRTYCEFFPTALPEKWGWIEPLDRTFNAEDLRELIPGDDNIVKTVDWKRINKPKAEGSFRVRWRSKSPKVGDTHSVVNFAVENEHLKQDVLVSWLKESSIRSRAHISLIDGCTDSYRSFALESGSIPSGDRFFLTTHVLRHWLPDIFWGTVFGPPYVKLFGRDRLLNAPVFNSQQIGENLIYIQLTQSLKDIFDHPSIVQECRNIFKKYMEIDAFFEPHRAYNRLDKGPQGDMFLVPDFKLKADDP